MTQFLIPGKKVGKTHPTILMLSWICFSFCKSIQDGQLLLLIDRDYAYQQISFTFLQHSDVRYSSLEINGFSGDDVQYLCDNLEPLKPFAANHAIKQLLKNPFFADLAYRVAITGTQLSSDDGELAFRNAVWRNVISKEAGTSKRNAAKKKADFY